MLFVRHGQSVWNALGRWQGQADPPLTDLGRQQAAHAAVTLPRCELVVCSTLARARETAEILTETAGLDAPLLEPRLMERDAGEWSGLTRVEIEERFPGYLAAERRPPGYETDEHLLVRVRAAVADLVAAHGDRSVLVVTHAGVVYALEGMLGQPWERLANLGGRYFHPAPPGIELGPRIDLLEEFERTTPTQI